MDDTRWNSVVARNMAADGKFVYCVKTTKIFCRPICKSRLARRSNVEFFTTPAEAQAAGYRACKRCQPQLPSFNPEADKIQKVCDMVDNLPAGAPLPSLDRLAREAGLTKHHFHRLFKRETGKTPREYAMKKRKFESSDATTNGNITPETTHSSNVEATSSSGEESKFAADLDKFSATADVNLSALDLGSFIVYYSIIETTHGALLIAFQGDQICKLELGTAQAELMESLESTHPTLYHLHSPIDTADGEDKVVFHRQIESIVEALENPSGKMVDVPLDAAIGNVLLRE